MTGRADRRHIVIGLTGASGSGKSEAARVLSGFGADVIDADKIARAVVGDRVVLDELVRAFGDWIVDGQGGFNRAAASKRAFADGPFLARLTEITHKYITDEIYARVDEFKRKPPPEGREYAVIVIDAPIPVEKGFLDLSDTIWVIKSPRKTRLERVVARDNISAGAAEARFSAQLDDAGYEKLADVVIDNAGDVGELAGELLRQYRLLLPGL